MEDFTFHRAASISDAQDAVRAAEDGKFLAGGQSLIPLLKLDMAAPDTLVSIAELDQLQGIERQGDSIVIGAAVTHAEVAESGEVRSAIPALAELAGKIGDPQVRNRGTLGGAVAHADPASDYPAALLGLGATIITDRREVAAENFFLGMFETPLEADEIIQSVRFPIPDAAAYSKFPNPASKYAVAGVMVARKGGDVRVAVTGGGHGVFRSAAMEEALAGDFSSGALGGVSIDAGTLISDIDASAEYRAHIIVVMAKKAVEACG